MSKSTTRSPIEIVVVNAETGEVIERDATSDELAQLKADQLMVAELAAEAAAKIAAKEAVLAKLGLTAEEAASLLA